VRRTIKQAREEAGDRMQYPPWRRDALHAKLMGAAWAFDPIEANIYSDTSAKA